jgi:ATP-dependent DNA helicase RecG
MKLTLQTPVINFHQHEIANLSSPMSRKLALAVATFNNKTDASEATVEDLLNYFPMRYEDRSNLIQIDELTQDMEASLDLYVRVVGGFRVGRNRGPKAPPLYIFEITAGDFERTRKPVVVFWFVSGKAASHAIEYYKKRFERGTRFVAFGKWEWDSRRNTFSLRLNKPDELELLPLEADIDSFGLFKEENTQSEDEDLLDDANQFPMIHVGRRVPVYRKLGTFQTKRLREIIFSTLQNLDENSFGETLPDELLKKYKLISRLQAVKEIHFPPENASLLEYENAASGRKSRKVQSSKLPTKSANDFNRFCRSR